MAFGSAGPSTIFASMCFHWALKAAMPSAVIRSTTCAGTSAGAICGGDVGGSGCADTAMIKEAVASTAPASSVATFFWSMVSSLVVALLHLLEAAGGPAWRHCGRRERGNEGARMRRLLAAHRYSARIDRPQLRVARQRPGELRALDGSDLADQDDRD